MSPTVDMTRFEQIRAAGDLPSPKGVALAIMQLTCQEDVSMAELGRVISGDPAFVGRLIKAANGLIALTRRPVVSVQEALMVVGLPAVRNMVLGFSLLANYRNGVCRSFDYNAFWSFSLALALAMQVFAERTRAGAPDELFSAGLLARVGELALATLYPLDYDRVLTDARRMPDAKLTELEARSFAMNHRELTAAMLADWGLPKVFVEVIGHFEDPEAADYPEGVWRLTLLRSLVAAGSVATLCHGAESDRATAVRELFAHGERIGIGRDDMIAACDRIVHLWADWCAMLRLAHSRPPSFAERARDPPVAAETVAPVATAELEPNGVCRMGQSPCSCVTAPLVLVVDADSRARSTLCKALTRSGYDVSEAADGRLGVEQALELRPQIMVVASDVPGLGGLELVRALRHTRIGKAIYMIMLAHTGDDAQLIAAFDAGADDFVVGPPRPDVLLARLRAGLRVVKLQGELEHEHEELHRFAAELAVTNRRLKETALTDALTGFPNRRYAIDRIQQEWQAAIRRERPLSCMILDLDYFKEINDTHGHDVGDKVLGAAADALRRALRGQDVICRTGGDEFLAICPDTNLSNAMICAERLRRALENLKLTAGATPLHISASIGVAMRETGMADVDALMKKADLGAYLAKDQGRNCVASIQHVEPEAHRSVSRA